MSGAGSLSLERVVGPVDHGGGLASAADNVK